MLFVKLFMITTFCSCGIFKRVVKKESTNEKIENTEKSEINTEKISKEIAEKIEIKVLKSDHDNQEINRQVDKKVREILSKLNVEKKSGNNGYSLNYNELKDLLELKVTIAESSNIQKVSTEKTESSETIIETLEKKVKKVPLWVFLCIGGFILKKPLIMLLTALFPFLGKLPFIPQFKEYKNR